MGLETVTYISDLNQLWPLGSDLKSDGDGHLRAVKGGLLTTFPNITGAVTATHTELNYVDGVTSDIQTQINSKAASTHSHSDYEASGTAAAMALALGG